MDEKRVINFMDEVQKLKDEQQADNNYRNSTENKLDVISKQKEPAKIACMNHVFSDLYKKSLPVSGEYKASYSDELDSDMTAFLTSRGNGDEGRYFTDCCKRSPICKKLYEKVTDLVETYYEEKADNIDKYSAEDMVFRMTDDTTKKLDLISKELEIEDISDIIADNVKATATAEISRAKAQKEANQKIEQELANDMSVKTESDINDILTMRGMLDEREFTPSLFQGIMIGNINTVQKMFESGHTTDYYVKESVAEYANESETVSRPATVEEVAFLESVKELTKLNIVKALRMEKLDLNRVDDLAVEYSQRGF